MPHLIFEKEVYEALGMLSGAETSAIVPVGCAMGRFGAVSRESVEKVTFIDWLMTQSDANDSLSIRQPADGLGDKGRNQVTPLGCWSAKTLRVGAGRISRTGEKHLSKRSCAVH